MLLAKLRRLAQKTGWTIKVYGKPQLSTVPQEKGVKLYTQKLLLKVEGHNAG